MVSPEAMWSEQRLLVRSRFESIWRDLPQLTLLCAFPGWGRTTWIQQCLAFVAEHLPSASVDEAATRSQLSRLLGERNDADLRIVGADGLMNVVD